jgi:subtilisin-like proprotein convertase family protein
MNLLYSTVTKNTSDFDANGVGSGGGIYLKTGGGAVDLKSTIVAGNNDFTNTAPDVDSISAGGAPTPTTEFSLIGNNKGSGIAAGALVGTPAAPINPRLGPLQNNGGLTKTHSLLAGSPAINAGDTAAVAGFGGVPFNDQRGAPFSRVSDGRIDIGSFEAVSPPTKPTMALLASSDTGMFNNDGVTNKMQPAFGGFGPEDATVLVYAQATDSMGNPSGDPFVIGTGTVGGDASDGFVGNDLGVWEVTVEPLADGLYNFFARFDVPSDGTGGLSDPVGMAPQTTTIPGSTNIPANGVAISQTTIAAGSAGPEPAPHIVDINVKVHITFGDDRNLILTLVSPSGTSILLSNRHGNPNPLLSQANYTDTVFDDSAGQAISAGLGAAVPPFTGTFRPDEPLSTLIGEPLDGTWTLMVANVGAGTGTIDNWSFTTVEPIPVVIDTVAPNLPFLDMVSNSDSGRSNTDNITRNNNPFVAMTSTDPNAQFAKLLFDNNLKFRVYDRFTGTDSSASGAETLIYNSATDTSEGAVTGLPALEMGFTANTLLSKFIPAFDTPPGQGINPDETLKDGTHNLKIVVEDRAGNISHEYDVTIFVDTKTPPASFGLPTAISAIDGLIAASDSGVTTVPDTYADRITNVTTPTFWGRAEANSVVSLYYDKNADGKIQLSGPNADIFLGQTTAIPLDGNDAFPNGYWQITSALDLNQIAGVPKDGLRRLLVTAEDVAGNPTPSFATNSPVLQPSDQLQIFIDTQGPQITNLTPNDSTFNLFTQKVAGQGAPTPLVNSVTIAVKDLPSRVDQTGTTNDFLYAALVSSVAQVPGNYVLVGDHVGTIAIQSITVTPGPLNQITGTLSAVTSVSVVTAGGFVGATTQPEVGDYVLFTTGAAVDQVRRITAYDSATGQMTFDIPLLNLPAVGDAITVTKAATATIKLTFAAPLPDDRYTLTTKDVLVDPAGNNLDGESHQIEPQPPLFASGNGVPGGNFGVRFTIDSHPEIGNYVAQNINIDINGNNVWDPSNGQIGNDATNVDLTFTLQVQNAAGATAPGGFNVHDLLFAGKFLSQTETNGAALSTHFDQLAAFGNSAETGPLKGFRWLIDTNGDGVITLGTDIATLQPTLGNFNVASAIPVAGNFDNNTANGDEIGLYNAGKWYLDTNHNFVIDGGDTLVNSTLFGAPIVGDFDGDGKVDLAVFNSNVFSFDLANNGFGTTDATITWGFPGVLDKPVAADMDQDGITDIGLWVPRTDATNPAGVAQWYFLISNDFTTPGVPAAHMAGSIAKINHQFSPTPLGRDFFAEFGDERSLPIVGNFDPPLSPVALAHLSMSIGDYDGNGKVDQADRAVWLASFGSTTKLAADGNGNGVIDAGDYSIWRDHLGESIGGAGSGADSVVADSLAADGAGLSGSSTPSQTVEQSVSSPVSSSIGVEAVAASPNVAPLVSTPAASSSSSADQSDRALLLLLNEQQPAGAALLDPSPLAGQASDSKPDEDTLAAPSGDALAVAWQSWGDL